MKILVVDDEIQVLRATARFLKSIFEDLLDIKVEIIKARDGIEALEKIEHDQPDLVFLDLIMPRKNGFDVLDELADLELERKPLIFIVSGFPGEGRTFQEALNKGAVAVIKKPAGIKKMQGIIQAHLPKEPTH